MTPVIQCSVSNVSLIPGNAFITRKNSCITRCKWGKFRKQPLSTLRLPLPLLTSGKKLPQYRSGCELYWKSRSFTSLASGTDVAIEEADTPIVDEVTTAASEIPSSSVETSEESSSKSNAGPTVVQSRRSRPVRKSEMPPIKNEQLIPGETFTGKVKSIQPFGAFVDFGAFTDGLVHVSQLSDSFVKDVGDIVSVGQEVKVRLVEANTETGRISLTMRENDSSSKPQQQKDAPSGSDKPRPARRTSSKFNQKSSKFVKGQDLEGTVKNLTRSGAFISLPEGEEGFLPSSEEVDEGFGNIMGGSSLEIGQEVSVRVLRITRGQATLTMKKEEDVKALDSQLGEGTVHVATNPFVLAFRKNQDIAAFLDEREKQVEAEIPVIQKTSVEIEGKANEIETVKDDETHTEELDMGASTVDNPSTEIENNDTALENMVSNSSEIVDSTVQTLEEEGEILASDESVSPADQILEESPTEDVVEDMDKLNLPEELAKDEVQIQPPPAENEISSAAPDLELNPEKNGSITSSSGQTDVPPAEESAAKAAISPALVKQLREETGAGMMDCKKALSESGGDIVKAQEFLRKKGLASADKKASRATAEGRIGSYIHDSRIGILIEVNCETDFVSRGDIFKELVDDLAMQVAACPQVQHLVTEDVPEEIVSKEREIEMQKEDLLSRPEEIRSKIVDGRIRKRLEELALLEQPYIKNDKLKVKDWVKQTIATIGENIKVRRFVRYNLGEGLEKKSQDFASEVAAQTAAKQAPAPEQKQPAAVETDEKPPTVVVSAALVKQLRDETGAGMMDCKKALAETEGDLEKAQEYLRKKGLSTADKKSSRIAAEGRIGSYIHDSRIGVLIEVNSETDFVGRSEKFKELVDDLAMQVVASPQVQFVSIEDIPESFVNKEKELEMQREDLLSKPENIRERIVEGRVSKRLGELVLLEQPFIKDDSLLVKDLVKQTVAALGENIKVRRFVRFTLGEGIEKENIETEA